MKVDASLTTLALAACAAAAPASEWDPLPKRDVATISNVIMQASTALTQLDTTVKAFSGGDFTQLASDATNLKTVLTQGTQMIMATSAITANDAITLQSSLSPVQSQGTALVNDLTAKKSVVEQASLCSTVQQQTADIGTAANGLIQATVMKIPANLQAVAGQLTAQFTGQLASVSAQFASGNCTNANGMPTTNAFSNSSAAAGTMSTPKTAAASSITTGVFGVAIAAALAGVMML